MATNQELIDEMTIENIITTQKELGDIITGNIKGVLQSHETYKADLVGGLVPSSQLPSYVDDIIEGYYYLLAFYKDSSHT